MAATGNIPYKQTACPRFVITARTAKSLSYLPPFRPQVRNSIDDIMWETVQTKLDTTGQLLDGRADNLQVG